MFGHPSSTVAGIAMILSASLSQQETPVMTAVTTVSTNIGVDPGRQRATASPEFLVWGELYTFAPRF